MGKGSYEPVYSGLISAAVPLKRYVPLLVLVFLAACAGGSSAGRIPGQIANIDMYKRGDGGETIRCVDVAVAPICGSREIGPEAVYSDCSNDEFNCIVSLHDVLAVPKAGLALGQEYSVYGARLKVEQCFIDRDACEIALISSRCEDDPRCACSESGNRTTTFYFSRDRGVTAFYTVPDDVASMGVDAKLLAQSLPLLTSVLVAEKGFLGEHLALRRAPLRVDCKDAGAAGG